MKVTRWFAIPIALSALFAISDVAQSQSATTISSSSGTITLNGQSIGTNSCAGNVSGAPSHVVEVAEDSNLRFSVQSQGGEPTLLIRSASGQKFCVQADNFSKGRVEIPGRWGKGTYSVFVGDRSKTQHAYTLLISRN
jgi:hypothetical protein